MVKLSDPITIRNIEFKNRLGYIPMRSFSSNRNGAPTKASFLIYEEKARGGAGLITHKKHDSLFYRTSPFSTHVKAYLEFYQGLCSL